MTTANLVEVGTVCTKFYLVDEIPVEVTVKFRKDGRWQVEPFGTVEHGHTQFRQWELWNSPIEALRAAWERQTKNVEVYDRYARVAREAQARLSRRIAELEAADATDRQADTR